jgi:hypothetical protein
MKNFLLLASCVLSLTLVSCDDSAAKKVNQNAVQNTAGAAVNTDAPVMTFDKIVHDFGTIKEGERVQTVFTFTNTGNSDLIIVDARGSCGCTVPSYPRNTPIPPGGTGEIAVSFDSSNKPNMQQKTVTLSANTQSGRETLRIKAMVTADPVKAAQREAQARARQQANN